ncbi:substrate-binding domain-containing protein [Agrococcus jejuensis]|uniref:substrate-binding domain-containing protein n=1 Tax=Agrococcus jejuensis TaxID=399736 RepID=UPI0011A51C7F|nr:substrate-binding domain-containing protein [Agrococcus jejuensis]
MRTRLLSVAALAATALVATGCSTVSNEPAASGDGDGAGPFTIGISNGFVGSEYRTQMISDIEDAASSYQDEGLLEDLVLENADTDVNGQIQQVRNLINAGVDAIIADPNSGSALDQVFQEATDQGILVFAIDQAVTADSVINVGIDQAEWAATSAEWLAEQVGEGGQIVAVNGISGHPANEARYGAAQEVFDEAGVEVLTTADGGWDQATGQQQMGNLLATYPEIDGVWTQDGMALGVLQAVVAAGREDEIVVTGEARNGFLQLWNEQSDDFESIGVTNPPGTGATALHLAMAMLQGAEIDESQLVDGNTLVLALEEPVTNENLDAVWAETEGEGESYVLDSILSADDVQQFLVQD